MVINNDTEEAGKLLLKWMGSTLSQKNRLFVQFSCRQDYFLVNDNNIIFNNNLYHPYMLKVGDPGVRTPQIIFIFRNFFGLERGKLSTLQKEKRPTKSKALYKTLNCFVERPYISDKHILSC